MANTLEQSGQSSSTQYGLILFPVFDSSCTRINQCAHTAVEQLQICAIPCCLLANIPCASPSLLFSSSSRQFRTCRKLECTVLGVEGKEKGKEEKKPPPSVLLTASLQLAHSSSFFFHFSLPPFLSKSNLARPYSQPNFDFLSPGRIFRLLPPSPSPSRPSSRHAPTIPSRSIPIQCVRTN